jgi:hypothetical protein
MRYLLLALALVGSDLRADPLIGTPAKPSLSRDGYQLILDCEVGGGERYYNRFLSRPEWPGGYSGVTIGVGYDVGTVSRDVFRNDWLALPVNDGIRLEDVAGITGQRAKARLAEVRDILIRWDLAEGVFQSVDIPRFWQLARATFPGFDDLRPNAQAALCSLIFNRGNSLAGPGRSEMREIARLSPRRDYEGMARQLRAMKRLWVGKGQDGLLARRDSEADLMQKP